MHHVCQMTITDSAATTAHWSTQDARNLYNIQSWGARYFDINDAGNVVAHPLQTNFEFDKVRHRIAKLSAVGLHRRTRSANDVRGG